MGNTSNNENPSSKIASSESKSTPSRLPESEPSTPVNRHFLKNSVVEPFVLKLNEMEEGDLSPKPSDNKPKKMERKRDRFKSSDLGQTLSLEKLMPLRRHKNSLVADAETKNEIKNVINSSSKEEAQPNSPKSDKKLPLKRKLSHKEQTDYCKSFKEKYKNESKMYLDKLTCTLEKYQGLTAEEKMALRKMYMPEYIIEWVLETNELNGTKSWKNNGKIYLDDHTLNSLKFNVEKIIGASEPFHKKRIWFFQYLFMNFSSDVVENPLLVINRQNILHDSYNQYMKNEIILSRPIRVFYLDEKAHDDGGVYRDWYGTLFNSIFDEKSRLFITNKNRCLERDTYLFYPKYEGMDCGYYEFLGKLMIKAIIDMINIKKKFNRVIMKHVIHRPVILEDLRYYDLDLYDTLNKVLNSNIDKDKEYADFKFVWNLRDQKGALEEIELIPDGKNIALTEQNKWQFIEKVIYYETFKQYENQILSVRKGLGSILDDRLNGLFSVDEINLLFYGFPSVNIKDWKDNTIYVAPYSLNHPVVKMFWKVIEKLKEEELEKIIEFSTGCSGVPVDGFCCLKGVGGKIMKFCISPLKSKSNEFRLIESKTCFNRIFIPEYSNEQEMEKAINLIINNDTDYFGLE